jgi:radical SAM superfamily enzyme YgiQ (UPF0313 family)
MRVLLLNPDFPSNFWSFDSVMELLGKRAHSPPLGLLTVAAFLPEHWEARLVDERIRPVDDADWEWCDLVFIGGMHVQCVGILAGIREARRRGKQVVVGGVWVFHTPEEAFGAGADIVVIGEAETAMPRLLEALEARETGLTLEGHELPDLTESPVPRYDLVDHRQYLQMALQTTRGCPFLCEFCDVTLINGRKARTKAPAQVLAELQHLHDIGWRRDVFFVDDTFNANPQRAKPMLREVIGWQEERGYPFGMMTQCSVNLAKTTELLELMAKAGFFRVFLGIESTEVEVHEQTKKHQNAVCDLDECCRIINEAGLQVIAGCIVGFDNEAPGADRRFFDFADRNQIPEMFLTILQAPPGTDLWRRLESEGRPVWKSVDERQAGSSGLMNFIPTRPIEDITREYTHLYDVLYTPENYLGRLYGHFRRMGPLPHQRPRRPPTWSEIKAILRVIWRRGVAAPSRAGFWRHLLAARRDFAPRFQRFLAALVFYEHLFEFRRTVRTNVEDQLAERAALMAELRIDTSSLPAQASVIPVPMAV